MTHVCFVTDEKTEDGDLPFIESPLSSLGITMEQVSWRSPRTNWGNFDLLILKSPWTYPDHYKQFEQWLTKAQRMTRVYNHPGVIRWSMDKAYLIDYAQFGVRIPVTQICSTLDEVEKAIDSLKGTKRFVVKPTISNGSSMTGLFRAEDPSIFALSSQILLGRKANVLVQEAVSSVGTFGESSFIFFDGELSHVVRKHPVLSEGGGFLGGAGSYKEVVTPFEPPTEFVNTALYVMRITEDILAYRELQSKDESPLYARLDFIMADDGEPLLLEAELFEPSWFLEQHPAGGARFARALSAALSRNTVN